MWIWGDTPRKEVDSSVELDLGNMRESDVVVFGEVFPVHFNAQIALRCEHSHVRRNGG